MKHLIQFSLMLIAYLLVFSSPLLAQNPDRTKTIPIASDSAYSKIIQVLQDGGYFIVQLDRPSGFIQTSTYFENSNFLSNKEGEKLIFNFLISPLQAEKSKIVLNIFSIQRRKGGSFDAPNDYDEVRESSGTIKPTSKFGIRYSPYFNKYNQNKAQLISAQLGFYSEKELDRDCQQRNI